MGSRQANQKILHGEEDKYDKIIHSNYICLSHNGEVAHTIQMKTAIYYEGVSLRAYL